MRILARDVANFVAEKHGITFDSLCSQARYRHIARPRQIAMYAIRRLCPHMSYLAIGRLLGGRDHTTILHGFHKIESLIPTDYEVAKAVADTLSYYRQDDTPAPLAAAVQWHVLCARYGQAMRLAA